MTTSTTTTNSGAINHASPKLTARSDARVSRNSRPAAVTVSAFASSSSTFFLCLRTQYLGRRIYIRLRFRMFWEEQSVHHQHKLMSTTSREHQQRILQRRIYKARSCRNMSPSVGAVLLLLLMLLYRDVLFVGPPSSARRARLRAQAAQRTSRER